MPGKWPDKWPIRKINFPVEFCPALGHILVQVVEVCPGYDPVPISQVKATVMLTLDKPDQTTDAKGEARFNDLIPDTYIVSVSITGDKAERYDHTEDNSADQVLPNKRTVFYFEFPTHWLKTEARYVTGQVAQGMRYTLKHLAKPGWKPPSGTDTTQAKPVLEKPVPQGTYRMEIKTVREAAWSKPRLLVGENVELSVKTSGFAPGTKGRFEILDARDLAGADILHQVDCAVTGEGDAQQMKTAWLPADNQLARLKSGWVVFRAVLEEWHAFSEPRQVLKKAKFDVQDKDGKPLETSLELVFTGGHIATGRTAGGVLEIEAPLCQFLWRTRLPEVHCARTTANDPYTFNIP